VLGEENKTMTVVQLFSCMNLMLCYSTVTVAGCKSFANILLVCNALELWTGDWCMVVTPDCTCRYEVVKKWRHAYASVGIAASYFADNNSPYSVKKGQSTKYEIYTKSKKVDAFYTCHILW